MAETAIVSKWGDSRGIRLPYKILYKANINLNDKLFLEVEKDGRIVMSRIPAPPASTLEYLFKDYQKPPFQTELIDLGEPVGSEKW